MEKSKCGREKDKGDDGERGTEELATRVKVSTVYWEAPTNHIEERYSFWKYAIEERSQWGVDVEKLMGNKPQQ